MMEGIAILWAIGAIFTAGTQYRNTVYADLIGNAKLLIKVVVLWPMILKGEALGK